MLKMSDLEKYSEEERKYYMNLFFLPVLERYRSRPLQDIVPLVFVLYAVYKGVELRFDDGRLAESVEDGCVKEKVLGALYRQTLSNSIGRKCREAEELYYALVSFDGPVCRRAIADFLESYILLRPGVEDTPLFPEFLGKDLARILSGHGARNVYESGSGLGLVSRVYDGWEMYTAFDLGFDNTLMAEVLQDITGKREVFPASRDYITMTMSHVMGEYDTFVLNLLDKDLYVADGPKDLEGKLEEILASGRCRLVVMMLGYEFCVDARYEGLRRALCERGILEEVVEIDGNCFKSGAGRSAVLVLDNERAQRRPVVFHQVSRNRLLSADTAVSFEELASCHFVLESLLYARPQWQHRDGPPSGAEVETVPFGSLVKEFVATEWFSREGHPDCQLCLTEEDYGRTPPRVFSSKAPHKWPPLPSRYRSYQKGSAVSILFEKDVAGYKVCRIDSKCGYTVPLKTISMVPADSVDVPYFICVLFMSEGLRDVLRGIRNMLCEGSFMHPGGNRLPHGYLADILATRPVRIVPDKGKQVEAVREIIRNAESVAKTDMEYGIVVVGTPFTETDRGNLDSWKIRIVAETDRVKGPGGLEEILKEDAEGLREVDAIFFDTDVERGEDPAGYDGLFDAMNVCGTKPLVAVSDVGLESFNRIVRRCYEREREKRKGDQFVFSKDGGALRNAVRDLRDNLDAERSPDRVVKAKYSKELDLAQDLDPSGDMTRTLVDAMRGEFHDDEDPRKAVDGIAVLRKRAEMLFNDAKERGLLPPFKSLGAFPQFLERGEYFDRNDRSFYRLTEKVMPETLSCAFAYFVTITNGGTHDGTEGGPDVGGYINETKSPNIYRSCACILMDMLRWYHGLRTRAGGPFYVKTNPFLDGDIVKKIRNGRSDYYYIGCVHLNYRPGLEEGLPGKRIALRGLGQERYPAPQGVEGEIRYYSDDYKIW